MYRIIGCLLLAFIVVVPISRGQGLGGAVSRAAYYDMTEPGDVSIEVHAWGAVSNAGLYKVVRGTELKELLSMAGGPDIGARTRRTKQTLLLKVIRQDIDGQRVVFDQKMENEILIFEQVVPLQDGDIIAIEQVVRRRLGYFDIIPMVSAVASLALLLERVLN